MTKREAANVYRQGDVWITQISRQEYRRQTRFNGAIDLLGPDPDKGLILAEGEATGHHHRIAEAKRVRLRPSRANGIVRLLEVKPERGKVLADSKPVALTHEEHTPIQIPPGYYEVRIQREYEPTAVTQQRRVYD